MKAISIRQPYASAIALGLKAIETRGWRTHYRGPLAIHASCTKSRVEKEFFERDFVSAEFRSVGVHSFDELPLGAIVAVCRLDYCGPIEEFAPSLREGYFGGLSAKLG